MKILSIILLSCAFISLNSCNKLDLEVDAPNCVKSKIRKIKNKPVLNPPAQVWKWEDDANVYYFITSGCCDQFDYLYDDKCKVVCAPSGGFTGMGDGNCPEFQGQVVKTLVWKDPRE